MATPASAYRPSPRAYPDRLPEVQYPAGHLLRRVDDTGKFGWNGDNLFLGKVLGGQVIGLLPLEPHPDDGPESGRAPAPGSSRYWVAWFGPIELGVFDERRGRVLRPRERRHLTTTV